MCVRDCQPIVLNDMIYYILKRKQVCCICPSPHTNAIFIWMKSFLACRLIVRYAFDVYCGIDRRNGSIVLSYSATHTISSISSTRKLRKKKKQESDYKIVSTQDFAIWISLDSNTLIKFSQKKEKNNTLSILVCYIWRDCICADIFSFFLHMCWWEWMWIGS